MNRIRLVITSVFLLTTLQAYSQLSGGQILRGTHKQVIKKQTRPQKRQSTSNSNISNRNTKNEIINTVELLSYYKKKCEEISINWNKYHKIVNPNGTIDAIKVSFDHFVYNLNDADLDYTKKTTLKHLLDDIEKESNVSFGIVVYGKKDENENEYIAYKRAYEVCQYILSLNPNAILIAKCFPYTEGEASNDRTIEIYLQKIEL